MRSLAFRFVRNSHPEKLVHVVDPNFDLRNRLRDPDLLQKELHDRKIKGVDAISISQRFEKWWNAYSYFVETEENTPEYRMLKDELLKHDSTLLDALKLPNRIELAPHFLEATQSEKWKIQDFKVYSSLMQTKDEIENNIFEGTNIIRLDPPRFGRHAITEAFNLNSKDVIQFHEGQNPSMHLFGITPAGLLVTFVSMRFGSSNAFPLSFLAKGAGYSRSFHGWQRQFVSIVTFENELSSLHSSLNSFRLSIERSLSSLNSDSNTALLPPHELQSYESSAAITTISSAPIVRYSSTGTYLSERLKIVADSNGKENPKFLNIGFVEIDVSTLHSILKQR